MGSTDVLAHRAREAKAADLRDQTMTRLIEAERRRQRIRETARYSAVALITAGVLLGVYLWRL